MRARDYHERTKHRRHGGAPRALPYLPMDPAMQPGQFKDYLGLEPVALAEAPDTGAPALEALSSRGGEERAPTLLDVSRILRWGAGVWREPLRTYFFRTYASAGALYPIEVSLACAEIDGLGPGLYHYHPRENALRRLREGDPRPWLARATGGHPEVSAAPAILVLSGIPWRTAWKYGERGWRHVFWDAGTMSANLLALARASRLRAASVLGFADADVDALLGLDGRSEASVALLPVGATAAAEPVAEPPGPLAHEVAPLWRAAVELDAVRDAHAASSLATPADARAWRRPSPAGGGPVTEPSASIEEAIRRRRSMRSFDHEPLPAEALASALRAATAGVASDWGGPLVEVLLIVHSVEGLAPGAYRWEDGFTLLREGRFRQEAATLALGQTAAGGGAVTAFIVADLVAVEEALGDRGYRAAQYEAGIVAGRMLLGAYALGFGGTALTFFDDEVRAFFGTEEEPMLVVALGPPRARSLR